MIILMMMGVKKSENLLTSFKYGPKDRQTMEDHMRKEDRMGR